MDSDTNFSITVYPVPTLTIVFENDTLCDGEITKPVFFHREADFFEWVATGNVSGLPPGIQSGNFGSYALSNKTSVSTKSIISVTPRYTLGRDAISGITMKRHCPVRTTTIMNFLPSPRPIAERIWFRIVVEDNFLISDCRTSMKF